LPDAILDKIGFKSPPPPNERRRAFRKLNKTP